MRSLKLSLLSLSLIAGISTSAAAQQVNFDDLTDHLAMINSPYAGFTWSNAFVMNVPMVYPTGSGGFGAALASGNRVMGNGGGNAMSVSGSSFDLLSGTFAAGWTTGLNLNVKGLFGGTEVYNNNYSLNHFQSSNIMLNMLGVDQVVFSTSGGVLAPEYAGNNQSFAADNLEFGESSIQRVIEDPNIGTSVVPEPSTYALMAAGLLVLGGASSRRRRAAQTR